MRWFRLKRAHKEDHVKIEQRLDEHEKALIEQRRRLALLTREMEVYQRRW